MNEKSWKSNGEEALDDENLSARRIKRERDAIWNRGNPIIEWGNIIGNLAPSGVLPGVLTDIIFITFYTHCKQTDTHTHTHTHIHTHDIGIQTLKHNTNRLRLFSNTHVGIVTRVCILYTYINLCYTVTVLCLREFVCVCVCTKGPRKIWIRPQPKVRTHTAFINAHDENNNARIKK